MNEPRNIPTGEHQYSQGDYIPSFIDDNGNEIIIPKSRLKWTLQTEENILETRSKSKTNILEAFRRFERWFNLKFGWFFTNPQKTDRNGNK